jgi:AAA15 family ATPase/GTPase
LLKQKAKEKNQILYLVNFRGEDFYHITNLNPFTLKYAPLHLYNKDIDIKLTTFSLTFVAEAFPGARHSYCPQLKTNQHV